MKRPILILAHAALGCAADLHPLAETLGDQFEVHAFDFEGHGAAGPAPRELRTAALAQNVLAYMDARDIATAAFFGHSLGGYVGLYLALHAPERISAVHTLGTRVYWDAKSASSMLRELDADKIEVKVPAFAAALARKHASVDWRELVRRTADLIEALGAAPDLTPTALGLIGVPVRIAVGERDHLVSIDMSVAATNDLMHGELLVLPKAAHPVETAPLPILSASVRQFFTR
jgi:pimeloyl-ACP methyl ester carboxylesterase